MFDETNWNRPFGFENMLTVNTNPAESDELLDLLNESFFDDGELHWPTRSIFRNTDELSPFADGTIGCDGPVTDYQVRTQIKMTKILHARSRNVTPKSAAALAAAPIADPATTSPTHIVKTEPVEIEIQTALVKRCREPNVKTEAKTTEPKAENAPAPKAPRVRKPKALPPVPAAPSPLQVVATVPPVSKLVQFSTRYVDMYVNVMNSGSFTTIQKFLYTYMARPCKLIVGHDVRPTFRVPKLSSAEGPALMAHYFLGCLVMYPDMLVDLKGSSTVTSPGGRKIVLRVETRATKSVDIPQEDWMPMMASLQDTYERFLQQPVSSSQARENVVEAHLLAQHDSTYTHGLIGGLSGGSDGNLSDSETSMVSVQHMLLCLCAVASVCAPP